MNAHTETHLLKETLVVTEYVPGHGEREGPIFDASRHQLIVVEKQVCYTCGATEHLEAHHHPIEFSMANDVDWSPTGRIRQDFPLFDWAGFDAKGGDPALFFDSVFNLRIYCKACHIGKDRGVHAVPYPLHVIRRYVRKDVILTPQEQAHEPADPAPDAR